MDVDTILHGDALATLRTLPDNSVHCCVTSPPYYGLRDYGVPGQIGLESSVEDYVARMVEVFAEVRRVLRNDGTCWLNLGDSYAGSWGNYAPGGIKGVQRSRTEEGRRWERKAYGDTTTKPATANVPGLKPKDLIGVPWRVAFALQAAGWWLRSDIIWAKKNCIPESVTDRPTRSHEYIFLFAKGQSVTRVVKFANLPSERLHFEQYFRPQNANVGPVKYCVDLATALLDLAQEQYDLRLPPLDSEVWQKGADGDYSSLVRGLPPIARFASAAARFYRGESSSKDFVQEIDSLWHGLANRDQLLIPRVAPIRRDAPSVYSDGDTSIAINDSGKVCEFDFVHDQIIAQAPTTCNYHYDADAIKESGAGRLDRSPGSYGRIGTQDWRAEPLEFPNGRNKRTVWSVATQPYSGAHFATFPPNLIEPCILAGCPGKVCEHCGAPWERITDRDVFDRRGDRLYGGTLGHNPSGTVPGSNTRGMPHRSVQSEYWHPTCKCANNAGSGSGVVLDPFFGSGTVGEVAIKHSRHYLGIELNAAYIQLAEERLGKGVQRVLWSAS